MRVMRFRSPYVGFLEDGRGIEIIGRHYVDDGGVVCRFFICYFKTHALPRSRFGKKCEMKSEYCDLASIGTIP